MNQMALAKAYATINKKRVVAFTGVISDLKGRGSSELVGLSWDKGFEIPVGI
jgi:hypothetical protein